MTAGAAGVWVRRSLGVGAAVLVTVLVTVLALTVPNGLFGRGRSADPAPLSSYAVPSIAAYPTADPSGAAIARGHWSRLPAAPIAGRVSAASAWTGREMLVWGGAAGRDQDRPFADGAAYDPATKAWRVMPASPLTPRAHAAAVWAGRELFVWGGYTWAGGARQVAADGARYDPGTRTWRAVAAAPLAARADAIALWTGAEVVIIGGFPEIVTETQRGYVDAAAYDPRSDSWRRLPALPTAKGRQVQRLAAVATSDGIEVWSAWNHIVAAPDGFAATGGLSLAHYDPATGVWADLGEQPLDLGLPLWTGREVVFPAAMPYRPGGHGPMVINLAGWRGSSPAGPWRPIAHGPVDDLRPTSLWTGAALLSFDSQVTTTDAKGHIGTYPGAAAAWDPATDRWSQLPPAPLAGVGALSAVWTGSRLIEWGLMHPRDDAGPVQGVEAGLSFG